MRQTHFCLTLLAGLALTAPASAQSSFPSDFNASASGFSIGQYLPNFMSVLQSSIVPKAAPSSYTLMSREYPLQYKNILSLVDQRIAYPVDGQHFGLVAGASLKKEMFGMDGSEINTGIDDAISAIFSSPADGNRVQALIRKIKLDPPLPLETVAQRLNKSYGEPHAVSPDGTWLFGFNDGVAIPAASFDELVAAAGACVDLSNAPRPVSYSHYIASFSVTDTSSYLTGRADDAKTSDALPGTIGETCDAGGTVTFYMDGDNISALDIAFYDMSAMLADQDAYNAAIQKYIDDMSFDVKPF